MKSKLFVIVLFIYCLVNSSVYGQSYWITNVNIIDVETGEVQKNKHIQVEGDIIKTITNELPTDSNPENINGNGKFVIPGLWDMHVHLDMVGEESIPLFLNYGVTGVRDMGGDINIINEFKSDESGLFPNIKTAGAILESPRFHKIINRFLGPEIAKTRAPFDKPEEAKFLVDSLVAAGSDFIKIRTIGGMKNLNALAEVCKEKGISFTGHIDRNLDLLEAVQSGISSIEHTDFWGVLSMKEEKKVNLAKAIAAEKAFYTPTLITTYKTRLTPKSEVLSFIQDTLNATHSDRKYISSTLLGKWALENSMSKLESKLNWEKFTNTFMGFGKTLAENHVPLLAGTDTGVGLVIPGRSLHEELELLVTKYGISTLEALQSATINATNILKIENDGIIKEAFKANMLLLDSNPLDKISNTQTISVVIKNGGVYNENRRAEILAKIEKDVASNRNGYENTELAFFQEAAAKMLERREAK